MIGDHGNRCYVDTLRVAFLLAGYYEVPQTVDINWHSPLLRPGDSLYIGATLSLPDFLGYVLYRNEKTSTPVMWNSERKEWTVADVHSSLTLTLHF